MQRKIAGVFAVMCILSFTLPNTILAYDLKVNDKYIGSFARKIPQPHTCVLPPQYRPSIPEPRRAKEADKVKFIENIKPDGTEYMFSERCVNKDRAVLVADFYNAKPAIGELQVDSTNNGSAVKYKLSVWTTYWTSGKQVCKDIKLDKDQKAIKKLILEPGFYKIAVYGEEPNKTIKGRFKITTTILDVTDSDNLWIYKRKLDLGDTVKRYFPSVNGIGHTETQINRYSVELTKLYNLRIYVECSKGEIQIDLLDQDRRPIKFNNKFTEGVLDTKVKLPSGKYQLVVKRPERLKDFYDGAYYTLRIE